MSQNIAKFVYIVQRVWWCAFYAVKLFFVFCGKLVSANIRLAFGILRPKPVFTSAIFSYRVEKMPPGEEFLLTNLLSLTPGTLTIDLNRDDNLIYVHTLYADECAAAKEEIDELTNLIKLACGTKNPPVLKHVRGSA